MFGALPSPRGLARRYRSESASEIAVALLDSRHIITHKPDILGAKQVR
jgi:hypothetical protein